MGALIHRPGEGEENGAFNLRRRFRVTAAATGGAMALWEEEIPPGAGPPLHVHRRENELFTVLSGRVRFHCDGEEADVGPGATVYIPAGAPHTFLGLGPETATVLVMLSPGKGEGFFRDVEAEGLTPPADMARIVEIAARYDLEFVGPPLAPGHD